MVNVKCPTSTCIFEDASFEVVHNVFSFKVHRCLSHLVQWFDLQSSSAKTSVLFGIQIRLKIHKDNCIINVSL